MPEATFTELNSTNVDAARFDFCDSLLNVEEAIKGQNRALYNTDIIMKAKDRILELIDEREDSTEEKFLAKLENICAEIDDHTKENQFRTVSSIVILNQIRSDASYF